MPAVRDELDAQLDAIFSGGGAAVAEPEPDDEPVGPPTAGERFTAARAAAGAPSAKADDLDAELDAIFGTAPAKSPVPPVADMPGVIPQEAVDTTETGMESVAKRLAAGVLRQPRAIQSTARMLGADVARPEPLPSYTQPQGKKGPIRQIGEAAVESAPQLLPSIGLRLLPAVGLPAQYLFSFSMEGGDAYEQALKDGLEESAAKTTGIISGLVNAGLESAFPGTVAESVVAKKGIRSLAAAAAKVMEGMSQEGSTEFIQTYVPKITQALVAGGKAAWKNALEDPDTALEAIISAGAGALTAGPIEAGAEATGAYRERGQQPPAPAPAPAPQQAPPAAPPPPKAAPPQPAPAPPQDEIAAELEQEFRRQQAEASPEVDPLARENEALRKIAAEDTLPTVEELAAQEKPKPAPAPKKAAEPAKKEYPPTVSYVGNKAWRQTPTGGSERVPELDRKAEEVIPSGEEKEAEAPTAEPVPAAVEGPRWSAVPQQILMKVREAGFALPAHHLSEPERGMLADAGIFPDSEDGYIVEPFDAEMKRRKAAGTLDKGMSIYDNSHLSGVESEEAPHRPPATAPGSPPGPPAAAPEGAANPQLEPLAEELPPLPRKTFVGFLTNAEGAPYLNIYSMRRGDKVNRGVYEVYQVREGGRGERVARLPGSFDPADFELVKEYDVNGRAYRDYRLKGLAKPEKLRPAVEPLRAQGLLGIGDQAMWPSGPQGVRDQPVSIITQAKEVKGKSGLVWRVKAANGKTYNVDSKHLRHVQIEPQPRPYSWGFATGDEAVWPTGPSYQRQGSVRVVEVIDSGDKVQYRVETPTGKLYVVPAKSLYHPDEEVKSEPAAVAPPPPAPPAERPPPAHGEPRVGKPGKIALARGGEPVTYRWAVMDIRDLVTSHDADTFDENPDYPQELQPRDRGRAAARQDVLRIAAELDPNRLFESSTASQGAPIVGQDRVVESGNGRSMALTILYESGPAVPGSMDRAMRGKQSDLGVTTPAQARTRSNLNSYVEAMAERAEELGLDLSGVERPVVVRIRETLPEGVTRAELTRQMNEVDVAQLSPSEQARADSERLTPEVLSGLRPDDDGGITMANSGDFVRGFMKGLPAAEQGRMVDSRGILSTEGRKRIERAVLARAYKNPDLLDNVIESEDNDIRTVGRALLRAAPAMVNLQESIRQGRNVEQHDVTQQIADAALKLHELRQAGRRVIDYMAQATLGGEELDPLAKEMLGIFGGHAQTQVRHKMAGAHRSAKKLGDVLGQYADLVAKEPDPRQGGMFGATAEPTPAQELFDRAMADVAAGKQPGIFEEQPNPAERGSLVLSRRAPAPPTAAAEPTTRFEGHEAEIELAKEGVVGPTLLRRVLDALAHVGASLSREQIHLARTGQNAQVLEVFRRITNAPSVATERVSRRLRRALGRLSTPQYDLFLDKLLVDNARIILEKWPEGTELPFGLTAKEIEEKGAIIDRDSAASERVSAAIADVRAFWNDVRSELEAARKALKLDSDFLHKQGDAYIHHQILEYTEGLRRGLSGGLRSPEGRPFMRALRGSVKAINLSYGQAQGQVLAQMLMDAEIARGLVTIRDTEDITDELRKKARTHNEAALYEKINKDRKPGEAKIERGDDDDPLHPFRIRIAKANSKIARLSVGVTLKDGTELRLPEAPGDLAEVEEDLREAYSEWQHEREGMDADEKKAAGGFQFDHPDWFRYLAWLASQGPAPGSGAAADIFRSIREREDFLERELGKEYVNRRSARSLARFAGDSYKVFQPRIGSQFYLGHSIADKLVEKILDEGAASVEESDLKEVMIRGGEREGWVMRREVVDALEEHGQHVRDAALRPFADLNNEAQRWWKQWMLISPSALVRYVGRNIVSDTTRAFAGNPSGLGKLPRAAREIAAYLNRRLDDVTGELRGYLALGGMSGTQFETELAEHQKRMLLRTEAAVGRHEVYDLFTGKRYLRWARGKVNLFESLNRYAQYLDYLEQLRSKDGLKNYGASLPAVIDALPDNETKAFWLSNELLGAYDQVSVMGQFLRRSLMPFWAFQELNIRTHYRVLKNAGASSTKAARQVAIRRLGAKAAAAPISLAIHAGAFLLRAALFESLLWSWNHLFFDDEEKELGQSIRRRTHIILGRNKDGTIRYFDRLSAFEEFRDFFGIDEFGFGVLDYLNGKAEAVDVAAGLLTHPLDKLLNLVGPTSAFGLKTAFELTTRTQLFPEPVSKGGRPIEDIPDYLARAVRAETPFRAITDRPQRPGAAVRNLFFYEADPGSGAYYDARSDRFRFLRQQGETGRGNFLSPRTTALHYYKRARLLGDESSATKWLQLYVQRDGTTKGLKLSFKSMDPLYGLDATEKEAFREWLDEAGRERLDAAIEYYHSVIRPDELPDLPPKLK